MTSVIPRAIADVELQAATAIAIGATSFTLNSANDDDGNALPAGLYCFTLDSGTSNKEYLIGQLNGVNITSVKSVSRQGVETTGAVRAHRVGSPCIVTNFATLQRVADILRGQLDLDGANPIAYDVAPTLSANEQLATVGYVLSVVAGGTVAFDAQVITGNAGEAVTAGQLVYFKTSDQEWYKTDADTAATVEGVQLGIALGTGSDGVAISGGIQLSGTYTTTGLTAGSLYYASNTAGAYATSPGTTSQIIGLALSTTKLLIIPRNPQTITDSNLNNISYKTVTKTAGATINGATNPVPVYQNKTDNEFYACDANDTAAMKFLGFAVSNGTDGSSISVQFNGIVSGFTGLLEGEKYYVQDAVGTIGTTPGTSEILVGVAISETELLIQKGNRYASGTQLFSSTSTVTITTGFKVSSVRVHAVALTNGVSSVPVRSDGGWTVQGGNDCIFVGESGSGEVQGGVENSNAWYLYFNGTGVRHGGTIGNITDSSFDLINTEAGSGLNIQIYWEAEGQL